MPNPSPKQTKEFIEKQFKAQGDLPSDVVLAAKPLCVKVPMDVDAAIRAMPDKSAWLRQVIIEAAERDGLMPAQEDRTHG